MSVDYSLALSRTQYDEEEERFRQLEISDSEKYKYRDSHVNLCSIGDDGSDLARILNAFDGDKMDEDFIFKMVRIIDACGTSETWERDSVINWMRKNINETYILVAE